MLEFKAITISKHKTQSKRQTFSSKFEVNLRNINLKKAEVADFKKKVNPKEKLISHVNLLYIYIFLFADQCRQSGNKNAYFFFETA